MQVLEMEEMFLTIVSVPKNDMNSDNLEKEAKKAHKDNDYRNFPLNMKKISMVLNSLRIN